MGASERIPACYGQAEGARVGHGQWPTGLLCDAQIKHLAEHHEMIDPFVARPTREVVRPCDCDTDTVGTGPVDIEKHGHSMDCASRSPIKVVSYGVTSYGYDMRVAGEFKVFTPTHCVAVDPKNVDTRTFETVRVQDHEPVLIPPNSFVLARSVERFKLPRDVCAIVLGKSTYARCGLVVNCTPLEPEWCGYLTIEISNTTPLPAKVYAGEGIAQVMFFKASLPCITSYADKGGKYQDQPAEVVTPRM